MVASRSSGRGAWCSQARPPARTPRNGKIVFVSNRADGIRELYVVNRDGSGERRLTFNDLEERAPVWSPDGSRIAFAGQAPDGNWDIYTVAPDGSDQRRLTTDPARDDIPAWTPDGRIVFTRGLFACPCGLWIVNADGSGEKKLDTGPGDATAGSPAPTGNKLAFASNRTGTWAIWVGQTDGHFQRQVTSPAAGTFGDFQPRWSPRGNDIAFLEDSTDVDNDLFVVHSDGSDLHRLTTTPTRVEFGTSWASDAGELVFWAQDPSGTSHLFSIRPDGSGETQLSTIPSVPLVEDFSGSTRDSSLWHVISDPGGSIGTAGGRLVASLSHDAVPGGQYNQIDEHWGSQCSLSGDYDFQIDWSLLAWPAHSGVFAALSAFFANQAVARQSTPWDPPYGEQVAAWTSSAFAVINSTATSGSFRLVRAAGEQYAYVRTGGSVWQLVLASPADPGAAVYGMGLSAGADQWAHKDVSLSYDNFRLNSGQLSCPTWWSDSWPDWGPSTTAPAGALQGAADVAGGDE